MPRFGFLKCFACQRKDKVASAKKGRETKRFHSFESQYDFLSIGNLESIYGTPRSSVEFHSDASVHHHTLMVNGIRYHPYSSLFGYVIDISAQPISPRSGTSIRLPVPYDFNIPDEIERELQLWVVNRYKDPPPPIQPSSLPTLDKLPAFVQERINIIKELTDEEQVIEPFNLLEKLRHDLSIPEPNSPESCVTEDERHVCLDYLVMDDILHRLRWKYPRIKTVSGLLSSIPTGSVKLCQGWNYEDCHSIDVWTRTESDGSLSVRCRSILQQPLFNAISLINEIDLHPQFMPHLAKAIPLHRMTGCGKRAQLLVRYIYSLPIPFANRDTVLFAFGCNAMAVDGVQGIIVSAQSIPEESSNWWGYSVPAPDRMVRERVRGMSFVMKPQGMNETELTVIANLDKQIALVPQSIINWMIKDMIKGLYKNMVKLNQKFPKTDFAKRIIEKPDFYDWVKRTLIKHEIHD